MEFNAAHLLKKVSYVCVLIGLLVSMYSSFRQSEILFGVTNEEARGKPPSQNL